MDEKLTKLRLPMSLDRAVGVLVLDHEMTEEAAVAAISEAVSQEELVFTHTGMVAKYVN